MPAQAMRFVLDHLGAARCPVDAASPWHVLVECDSAAAGDWLRGALLEVLGEAMEEDGVSDAVLAESNAQRAEFWRLRESISAAQSAGGLSLKHDISLPTAVIPEFMEAALAELAALVPGIRPCVFGHLGDGNLHFNLSQPEGMGAQAFRALEREINDRVFQRVLALGGSIAAEHGIGLLRRGRLAQSADATALESMKRIKQVLDPHGLLNPGKVLSPD